ncbi:DNA topoisomerase IB [Vallicoccus soli]|uniref:DNA topoisomerase n=1 Tax=Vallicoccus soli TaxID=2339232 RepID=A0A3A3Z1W3_9ACTN|nr:DNA topoisomerase IB [Vallicoccus soli]
MRRGRGFSYVTADGEPASPEDVQRARDLVIPPAWQDVWICPWPNGHIQAVGTDAAGRRQYRYHDAWRVQRDQAKHDRVLQVARRLPAARQVVAGHLAQQGYGRERVLACAFRLLDLGFFRIGSEEYAEDNGTFGLATIRREHVSVHGDTVVFEYLAKHGKERLQSVVDPEVRTVVRGLQRRRDDKPELLAYKVGREWRDVRSTEVNEYVRSVVGGEVSAKDFRTWHATVLTAVGLAVSTLAPQSPTARKRAVTRVVKEVSDYLGNTPTVARSSYIDPRVIDLFNDGITIMPALESLGEDVVYGSPATHGAVESAVLDLLGLPPEQAPAEHVSRDPDALEALATA